MNKYKKLIILACVLVAACIVTFAVSRYEEKKEEIKNSDEIVLAIDAETATALSWEYEETSLGFHKNGTWLYDDDEAFPVNQDKVEELINVFSEFGAAFIIENVEDYAQYGLEEPECTINISAGNTSYEIKLGDYSTLDRERYFSIGDGNVYLASSDPYDDFELVLEDMIQDDEVPEITSAAAINFSGEENYDIEYEENSALTYCSDDVYFTDGKPLDTTLVASYLDEISALSLTEYVSYNVSDEELAEFGLDSPDLTVTIDYPYYEDPDDGEAEPEIRTFAVSIGRNREELAVWEEADGEEADGEESEEEEPEITVYARVGDSQIVYQITSDEYESLMAASYDDLRHKEVLTASFDDVYRMDIVLEDEGYTIESETVENEDGEEVKTWYYNGEAISLSGLISAVGSLTADSFTDEEPTEKEEISFIVYLDNDNYPEVEVHLFRYDGSVCLAVVDEEPVSFVLRSKVVSFIETVNAIVLN